MIRRARNEDIPDLLRLLEQVNRIHAEGRPDLFRPGTKYDRAGLEAILADDSRPVFVFDRDGQVAGYLFGILQQHVGDRLLTDIKTLYIDDLCVDQAARGQHIGRSLYEHALAYARECGCHNVTLNVWALNPDAMAFYRRVGMQVQKVGLECVL